MDLLPPILQQAWGWPALSNFMMGGAGAGLYLIYCLEGILQNGLLPFSANTSAVLWGPLATLLGFAALGLEAGRPLRAIHLLRNLRTSSLSHETLLWACFIVTAILDWLVPHPVMRICAMISALAFILSQGVVLYRIRAIGSWHTSIMPVFFISSGFASGFGFALVVGILQNAQKPMGMVALGMLALIANAALWIIYLFSVCSLREAEIANEPCRKPLLNVVIIGIGHLIPLGGLWLGSQRMSNPTGWSLMAQVAMGLAILMGVLLQKKAIILDGARIKKISIASVDD